MGGLTPTQAAAQNKASEQQTAAITASNAPGAGGQYAGSAPPNPNPSTSPGNVAYNAQQQAKLQASLASRGQSPEQLQAEYNASLKDALVSARLSENPQAFLDNWAQTRFGISDYSSTFGIPANLYTKNNKVGTLYLTPDAPALTSKVDNPFAKSYQVNLNESLGLNDAIATQNQLAKNISTYNGGVANSQNRINQIDKLIPQFQQQIKDAQKQGEYESNNVEAGYGVTNGGKLAQSLTDQLNNLFAERDQLTRQRDLFGNLSNSTPSQLAQAQRNVQSQQARIVSATSINPLSNPLGLPRAFAEQQQGKRYNVNLTDSLAVSEGNGKNNDLVSGIAGPAQDPFGNASEATAGFGTGFVDLSSADILGVNKANINKLNSDVSYLANTPGLSSITADFGEGVKKTYTPQQALGGILNEITAREKAGPKNTESNFGLTLQGNFEPTQTSLSPQQRQQQKQSFQQSQTDLLGNLANVKAKGLTSLEITDANGKIIGTTNPQDTTKARYDILKASLQGPVSVKGGNVSQGITPGKNIDLSNTDYSQLVDIGAVPKPQTPLEYINYYGRRAERSFANPIEYVANQITGNLLPNNKELQFNISPTTSDVALGGVTQAVAKKVADTGLLNTLGIKTSNTETRGPTTILKEETGRAASSIIQDPFGFAVEIPGEIGNVITQSKLAELGLKGALAIGGKIGGSLERKTVESLAEKGLREGKLEFQVEKPVDSNLYEFEQGTAGKSGKVTDVIPQEFGIGAKGEKVPQLNLPPEIKIPSPEGEGTAKVPLAFINPEKEGSVLIAREGIQNILEPNRILVKGVEPKLAEFLGLKPVKNKSGLFIGPATKENIPLIEGAAETNKIKPVTDFLEIYYKDFKENPSIHGLFAREPRTLIPKNQNYPFQSFTRPNIIRYYEGYQGGFERAKSFPGLDRLIQTNELYPRIRTAVRGYIDLSQFNPRDFSIVGTGSKGIDRYLTDLGLSPATRKRTFPPRKTTSGISSNISERYPLMKSGGLNQETTDLIRDIAYGYKPLPRGVTKTKEPTPLYPLPGLSEATKERNRKATQQEDQALAFEVLGYPSAKSNIGSFSDIVSFKKSPSESRTKTVQINKEITSQFSGLNLLNPLKEHNQSKSKSALGLILSLKPAQGLRQRNDQRNNLLQDIVPIQTTRASQRTEVGFKYKYEQQQRQQQINKFADQLRFTVPAQPKETIPELRFGGTQWPRIYGINSPKNKHGSRTRGSFFTYTVNPNKIGDIADVGYKSGKYVGNRPIKLRFSGNKLDSLLGTSEYSRYKRKSKKGSSF